MRRPALPRALWLAVALATAAVALLPAVAAGAPTAATLVFAADAIDAAGGAQRDRILVGGEEVAVLREDVDGYATVRVPIPAHRLASGVNELAIVSGRRDELVTTDYDVFTVRDVRLELPDGTRLTDPRYPDPAAVLYFGGLGAQDAPGGQFLLGKYLVQREFRFDVPHAPAGIGRPATLVTAVGARGDAKPLRSETATAEVPLDPAALAAADDVRASTAATDGFATQRFDLVVAPADLAGATHVEVEWEGRTPTGRGAALYAYDHALRRYQLLASAPVATGDVVLRGSADVATMVRDGRVRLLVQERQPGVDERDFTFAWLTDTQYNTFQQQQPSDIIGAMSRWIVANSGSEEIAYAIHTGDITQSFATMPNEFTYASEALQPLDNAKLPYGVVPGNHEYPLVVGRPAALPADAADPRLALYEEFFGVARYGDEPHFGGSFRGNEHHYDLITAGGEEFLILYIGYQADDAVYAWAQGILDRPEHADRRVILAVHEYTGTSGNPSAGRGTTLLNRIVIPNEQIFLVLSGHFHGVAYTVRRLPENRVVLEVLEDYQEGQEGGSGYLKLLRFDLDGQQISGVPYSPYVDDFGFADFNQTRDEFVLPLQFDRLERRIETDRIAAGVPAQVAAPVVPEGPLPVLLLLLGGAALAVGAHRRRPAAGVVA